MPRITPGLRPRRLLEFTLSPLLVNLPMPRQLITPREGLAALLARVRLLAFVRPHVLTEVRRFGKGRGAARVGALKGFGAGVSSCIKSYRVRRY